MVIDTGFDFADRDNIWTQIGFQLTHMKLVREIGEISSTDTASHPIANISV